MSHTPLLSIGLPVYNGARFVRQAIDSMLGQTFGDFELLISDNASTDETEAICREYAARDGRVKYFRNQVNVGATKNFNKVFNLSSGRYFKWIANDDEYDPAYLESCIGVMEKDPGIALCHSKTKRIDVEGNVIGHYGLRIGSDSRDPVERFRELLMVEHACFQIFGVMRRNILKRTNLFGSYSGADRVLIAETSLYGRHHEVPEFLFLRRSHPHESRMLFPDRNSRIAWFDPAKAGRIVFSEWRILKEYYLAVRRSNLLNREKLKCYVFISMLGKKNWRDLAHDVKSAGKKFTSRTMPFHQSLK